MYVDRLPKTTPLTDKCIDQGDKHDVHSQISEMGAIYGNAYLTIFAVAGDGPSYGLPGVGHTQRRPLDDIAIGPIILRNWRQWNSERAISSSKWASRAWTLQECFFSRRRVFFTEREVVFSSNAEIVCEYTPAAFRRSLDHTTFGPLFMKDAKSSNIRRLIETYSDRYLGCQEDALNAIAGILNTLGKPGMKHSHMWGIPFTRPEAGDRYLTLLWCSFETRGIRRHAFPSWSPLGWTSRVSFREYVPDDNEASVEAWTGSTWRAWDQLGQEEIEDLRKDPPIESQFLRVRTLTFHLDVVRASVEGGSDKQLYCAGLGELLLEPEWDGFPEHNDAGEQILCAVFNEDPILVLLLKPPSNSGSRILPPGPQSLKLYERVGVLKSPDATNISITDDFQNCVRSKWRHHFDCAGGGNSEHNLEGQIETFLLG